MELETSSNDLRWYAVYTKTGEEDRAENNLRAWQIETFTPRTRARRIDQATGKPTFLAKPLFPRYLFARFKANETLHKVWYTRGVHSVVSFGSQPAPVADEIIEFIQLRRGKDEFVNIGEALCAGDKVKIKEGPFRNFVGIFEGTAKERDRVSLLLSVVNFQNHVIVERSSIEKLG